MPFTHTVLTTYRAGSESVVSNSSRAFTGTSEVNFSGTIAAHATNTVNLDLAFEFADIVCFVAIATRDMTIRTNSSSSPDDSLVLTANVPYVWHAGRGTAPFDANITALYILNASGSSGTLTIRALLSAET